MLFLASFMAGVLLMVVPGSIVSAAIDVGQHSGMRHAVKFATGHLVGYLVWLLAAIPFVWFGLRLPVYQPLWASAPFCALYFALVAMLPLMNTIQLNAEQVARTPLLSGLGYGVKNFSTFIVAICVFATFVIHFLSSPTDFNAQAVEAVLVLLIGALASQAVTTTPAYLLIRGWVTPEQLAPAVKAPLPITLLAALAMAWLHYAPLT